MLRIQFRAVRDLKVVRAIQAKAPADSSETCFTRRYRLHAGPRRGCTQLGGGAALDVAKIVGVLGTAGGPGAEWYLPDSERDSPPVPYSSEPQLVDPALFDLETVLEEIAPESAASEER